MRCGSLLLAVTVSVSVALPPAPVHARLKTVVARLARLGQGLPWRKPPSPVTTASAPRPAPLSSLPGVLRCEVTRIHPRAADGKVTVDVSLLDEQGQPHADSLTLVPGEERLVGETHGGNRQLFIRAFRNGSVAVRRFSRGDGTRAFQDPGVHVVLSPKTEPLPDGRLRIRGESFAGYRLPTAPLLGQLGYEIDAENSRVVQERRDRSGEVVWQQSLNRASKSLDDAWLLGQGQGFVRIIPAGKPAVVGLGLPARRHSRSGHVEATHLVNLHLSGTTLDGVSRVTVYRPLEP